MAQLFCGFYSVCGASNLRACGRWVVRFYVTLPITFPSTLSKLQSFSSKHVVINSVQHSTFHPTFVLFTTAFLSVHLRLQVSFQLRFNVITMHIFTSLIIHYCFYMSWLAVQYILICIQVFSHYSKIKEQAI